MAQRREIRSYDYVNHPYERVREALDLDPRKVFAAATQAASSRARSVASALRVNLAGIEVGAEIDVELRNVEHRPKDSPSGAATLLSIRWEAASRPRLFPLMDATLSVYPLTPTETQLDFLGRYEPPLGALGGALDAMAGHRIAEASVHRFVSDVAAYLRNSLGQGPATHP
jgi:hypothetical protein